MVCIQKFGYVPFLLYLYGKKLRIMLPVQSSIPFSDYSSLYDLLVPQTNLLRQINDLVDFSFIRKELLAKYCSDNGRTAECPVRMFKYLLLKIIMTYLMLMWLSIPCMIYPSNTFWVWYPKRLP